MIMVVPVCLRLPSERAHIALRSTDMLTRLFRFPLSVCSYRNIAAGSRNLIGATTKTWIHAHGRDAVPQDGP